MADTSMTIRTIPADLRGKEIAIPAGYLHENKQTAGIAGIETNPSMCGRRNHVCHMRLHALENERAGCYPRFPRRVRVFKHLTCGDRSGRPPRRFLGSCDAAAAPPVDMPRKKTDSRGLCKLAEVGSWHL